MLIGLCSSTVIIGAVLVQREKGDRQSEGRGGGGGEGEGGDR